MTVRPYEGLRVVDFSTTVAGPHCARLLADMGAAVIKIEAPEGEMLRIRPPLRDGFSTLYGQLNAGKQSVVLDLKSPQGREAARALALQADIVVENFRPGVMDRLGLGHEALCAANPRLIYCAVSGYGQTGPSSQRPAYAPVIHADSGFDLAQLSYQGGRERPDYCGIYHADVLAGTYAFGAIGVALHLRHATGRGRFIDVSMFESMLSVLLNELQGAQFPLTIPSRPLFGPIETADGYLMLAVGSEKTFEGIAAAAVRPDVLTDPRFARYPERRANWSAFIEIVEAWSRTLSSDACLARLEAHGVPAARYRTVAQALADPQTAHRGAMAEVEDPAGVFKALNPPFRISGANTTVGRRVAGLGADTRAVLEAAGLPVPAMAVTEGESAGDD
jgi:crotonobetainyl-CoA:carnitine CoA-transferase CaiB-like acyl-CoA transferase